MFWCPASTVSPSGAYLRPRTTLHGVDPYVKLIVLDTAYLPDYTCNIVGKPLVALRRSWDMKIA